MPWQISFLDEFTGSGTLNSSNWTGDITKWTQINNKLVSNNEAVNTNISPVINTGLNIKQTIIIYPTNVPTSGAMLMRANDSFSHYFLLVFEFLSNTSLKVEHSKVVNNDYIITDSQTITINANNAIELSLSANGSNPTTLSITATDINTNNTLLSFNRTITDAGLQSSGTFSLGHFKGEIILENYKIFNFFEGAIYYPGNPLLFFTEGWRINNNIAVTTSGGQYFKFSFKGESCSIQLDVSRLDTAAVPVDQYPIVSYWLDDVKTSVQLQKQQTTLNISNPTFNGNISDLVFFVESMAYNPNSGSLYNRWNLINNIPLNSVIVTGVITSELLATTTYTKQWYVYGDSITEGAGSSQKSSSYPLLLGKALSKEMALFGFSGLGWGVGDLGNRPTFINSWDKWWDNTSKTNTHQPEVILNNLGRNDFGYNIADNIVQTNVTQWIQNCRTKYPSATIIIIIPFQGVKKIPITSGFNNANLITNKYLIDISSEVSKGFKSNSVFSSDSIHPIDYGHATIAALLTAKISSILLEPSSFGTFGTLLLTA